MAQLLDSPGSLLHQHRSQIHFVSDVVTNTISSSAVRQELRQVVSGVEQPVLGLSGSGSSKAAKCLKCGGAQGRSVRYLIPEEVRSYIAAHSLYAGEHDNKQVS